MKGLSVRCGAPFSTRTPLTANNLLFCLVADGKFQLIWCAPCNDNVAVKRLRPGPLDDHQVIVDWTAG